jgi:hypothetical protein
MEARIIRLLAVVSVVTGVFAVRAAGRADSEREAALTALEASRDSAALVVAENEALLSTLRGQDVVIDSLTRLAGKHAAQARSRRAASVQTRAQLDTAVAAAPDTCSEVAERALAALQTASDEAEGWQAAHEAERAANGLLEASRDSLATALARANAALDQLDRSAARYVETTRPSLLSQLAPKAGFGVAVGVDAIGRPHVIAGLTLGWRF